ncbi:hypothetical protein CLIB1444_01S07646 [[Candida] jaroonii]|uniref:Uncharacterized protein n=1 Tax=[Candida] jaroonii TaxID=467808 RepID=A0ACA9Y0Q7_9ASCO|nr:hypothetical protein CLIB1444_01S07646 [[Candida] jaroonii]
MKSFIKTHKRSESLQSTGSIPTPLSSPILNQSPTSNNSNSPKKLLMPIKHLFHKRRTSSEVGDYASSNSLNYKDNSSSTDLPTSTRPSLLTRGSNFSENSRFSRLSDKIIPTLNSLNDLKRSTSKIITKNKSNDTDDHTESSRRKVSIRSTKSKRNSIRNIGTRSASSIRTKISNFNGSSDSMESNDSNFSFVKDMKGGRNTSIKYYKTKPKPKKEIETHYFENEDLDIDDDYDYENNGLDDFDNDEEEINYIDQFDDGDYNEEPKFTGDKMSDRDSDDIYDDIDDYSSYSGLQKEQDEDIDKRLVSHIEDYDDENYQDYDYDEDLEDHEHDSYYIQEYQANEESNRRYNQAYFENESILTLPHNKIPFNHSYHLSIEGIPNNSSQDLFNDEYEILEDYLDIDGGQELPSPKYQSYDNLELFDLNSPLINGLTIGGDLNNGRYKNFSPNVHIAKYKSKIRSFHLSIDEIDLLKSDEDLSDEEFITQEDGGLGITDEGLKFGGELNEANLNMLNYEQNKDFQYPPNSGTKDTSAKLTPLKISHMKNNSHLSEELKSFKSLDSRDSLPKKINRQSINEMMNLLENLQIDNEEGQRNKRNSIENMMNFLQTIQKSNIHISPKNYRKDSFASDLSLPQLDNDLNFGSVSKIVSSTKSNDDLLESTKEYDQELNELEKDLIDEINQLPEDFDFDANEELLSQFDKLNKSIKFSSFMRSNSFNKKPKKMAMSSNLSSNKVQMSNKTVTYYNSYKNPDKGIYNQPEGFNEQDESNFNEEDEYDI